MFSSASSISGLTIASTSSFHGPGQPRASNSSAPPLESLSRFTPLTVNQAYAQRVPKHRSPANQGQGPATSARGGGLAHRRTQDVRREEILSRQPAGKDGPTHLGGHHQG